MRGATICTIILLECVVQHICIQKIIMGILQKRQGFMLAHNCVYAVCVCAVWHCGMPLNRLRVQFAH